MPGARVTGTNFGSGGGAQVLGKVEGLPAQRRSAKLGGGKGGKKGMRTGRKDKAMTPFTRAVTRGR